MKEQRRIEIENLKNAKGEMKQEKFSKKEQLSKRAAQIAEDHQAAHEARMKELRQEWEELDAKLAPLTMAGGAGAQKGKVQQDDSAQALAVAEERRLLTQYEQNDKVYTEALESYDQDMKDSNKAKADAEGSYNDQAYQLQQVVEQWKERTEENDKRKQLMEIMKKKEMEKEKHEKMLNDAAQFLQAHYRGMLSRRELEKSMRGKKGRKGRKR